jgi:crossover junction endodeoxyribonuclease RusA
MITFTVTVPGELVTANRERRLHFQQRARFVKQWRSDSFWAAKQARIPRLRRASITITPHQVRGRLADAGGHAPVGKAIVDGLVDAGVLTDDSPDYLDAVIYAAAKRSTTKCDYVVVEISSTGSPYRETEKGPL